MRGHHQASVLALLASCATAYGFHGTTCQRLQPQYQPQLQHQPSQRPHPQQQHLPQQAATGLFSCRRSSLISMAADGRRRPSRVGHVIQAELATVIRSGDVRGTQRIPDGLNQLISIVDVDMSPDLRNARVKVSIMGDRKDKVSAVRWLRKNVKGLRHELAQRNRGMKRIPQLSFDHVDVGAATDMMIKLEELRQEGLAAAEARGDASDGEPDVEGGIDFSVDDDDAWLDEEDDDDDLWDDEEEDDE